MNLVKFDDHCLNSFGWFLYVQVKLADVLLKFILPISFLNHWPPKCLAIQFATTQYIPWKSEEVMNEGILIGYCILLFLLISIPVFFRLFTPQMQFLTGNE